VRVTQVDEVNAFDLEVGDQVALVVAGQALELSAMLGVQVRHEERLHRLVRARLPALLQPAEGRIGNLTQGFRPDRVVLPGEELERLLGLVRLPGHGCRAVDEIEVSSVLLVFRSGSRPRTRRRTARSPPRRNPSRR